MCIGGKPPEDNSAQVAAQRETERQAAIAQGRTNIDNAFAKFDDPFYSGVSKSYTDYYMPQLKQQYDDAYRKLVLNLGGTGNLASGSGARQLGDLTQRYAQNKVMIANQGGDQANSVRGDVENARNDLYSLNSSAADPASIATDAAARAGSIGAPRAYSPLQNLFADIINNSAAGIRLESAGYPGLNTGLFNTKVSSKAPRGTSYTVP